MVPNIWLLGSVSRDSNTVQSIAYKSDNHRESSFYIGVYVERLASSFDMMVNGSWHLCIGMRAPMIECIVELTAYGPPEDWFLLNHHPATSRHLNRNLIYPFDVDDLLFLYILYINQSPTEK